MGFLISIAWLKRFLASVLTGLFANMAIMSLAVQLLGLHYLLGIAAALIVVSEMGFLINKFRVFGRI